MFFTIKDLYERASTIARTQSEATDFSITIGLHQGSTLTTLSFYISLDILTKHIQEPTPRCMFFADDIVLLGELRKELNGRLETWGPALEAYDFHLSRSKTKYMEYKFRKR